MLQSLASLVAAQALNPVPGSRVLDMCAAPGGKTTALAQLMGDRGQVVALDRSHAKVQPLAMLSTPPVTQHLLYLPPGLYLLHSAMLHRTSL